MMFQYLTAGWCATVAGVCLTILIKRGKKLLAERRMNNNLKLAIDKIAEGRL